MLFQDHDLGKLASPDAPHRCFLSHIKTHLTWPKSPLQEASIFLLRKSKAQVLISGSRNEDQVQEPQLEWFRIMEEGRRVKSVDIWQTTPLLHKLGEEGAPGSHSFPFWLSYNGESSIRVIPWACSIHSNKPWLLPPLKLKKGHAGWETRQLKVRLRGSLWRWLGAVLNQGGRWTGQN